MFTLMSALVHSAAVLSWYQVNQPLPADRVEAHAKMVLRRARRAGVPAALSAFMDEIEAIDQEDIDLARVEAEWSNYVSYDGDKVSLTDAAYALSIREIYETRNFTAAWLDDYLTEARYKELNKFLRGRVQHSRDEDECSELVHEFLARFINADSLKVRLLEGRVPAPSEVRSWAWRRALTIFRDEGTDAQTRSVKNARTDRDLRNLTPTTAYKVDPDRRVSAIYDLPDDGGLMASSSGVFGSALVDVIDQDPRFVDEVENHEYLTTQMAKLNVLIDSRFSGQTRERYRRMVRMMSDGRSVSEVAAAEGVTRNRAHTMWKELQQLGKPDQLTRRVCSYLDAEPMSTVYEIVDDLRADVDDVNDVLDRLVKAGTVRAERHGSYRLVGPVAL